MPSSLAFFFFLLRKQYVKLAGLSVAFSLVVVVLEVFPGPG